MKDFYHGSRASQKSTAVSTPVTAQSGLPFVIGAAPVQAADDTAVNRPVLARTYSEAVAALGYSDDWQSYDLCEMMDSHFKRYGMAPVIFVNVLDPKKHKKTVEAAEKNVVNGRIELPLEVIKSTVKVSSGSTECAEGEDYELIYDTGRGHLLLEVVSGGKIPAETQKLQVGYDQVDPTAVTKDDIIGGYDTASQTYRGLEVIEQVFPKYLMAPDLILAPNWSGDPEVAAVMAAKAEGVNTLFGAKALIDVDTTAVRHYQDVAKHKENAALNDVNQIPCWPMVALEGRRYHMSVHLAGVMAQVDAQNGGCPCESPSNKTMQIDSTVLSDGSEVILDITQANFLNSIGVMTALNFIGGFVAWGNYNACWPDNTDVKDCFIAGSRMFSWVSKAVILTYWSRTDRKMLRRLIDSIVDAINYWLNGLTADEKLLGGRVAFLAEENNVEDLKAGIMKFHIYMTPCSPAQEIDYILEYDPAYVESALTV